MLRAASLVAALLFTSPALAEGPRLAVLTPADADAYRIAFAAADAGDFDAARAAARDAQDGVLSGHLAGKALLAQRRAPYERLSRWLEAHGDSALAPALRERALAARPRGAPLPATVSAPVRRGYIHAATPPAGDGPQARAGIEAIVSAIAAGDFEGAALRAETAAASARSGEARWWAGLLAFRRGEAALAASHFAAAADWPHFDGWREAGAHYWAARAHIAAGAPARALPHLSAAAERPATFYGQLAEAQLGRETPLAMAPPALNEDAALAFVTRHPAARRAAALVQIGRLGEAEAELRRLFSLLPRGEEPAFLAFAQALAAPGAQLRAAEFGGPETASGFCPIAPFAPADGFRLDRALVYAVTRQESRFDPSAVSSSNAQGLMQLLPSTADYVAGTQRAFRRDPARLHEPALNMRLGQQYLEYLNSGVGGGDVGRIFAAYNGGPGFLARWIEAFGPASEDPLLLIEMLPRGETRDFAERVQSHLALCRKRLNQRPLEMEALASGRAPLYQPQDAPATQAQPGV